MHAALPPSQAEMVQKANKINMYNSLKNKCDSNAK